MKIAPIHGAFPSRRDEHPAAGLVPVRAGRRRSRNLSADLLRDLGIPGPDIGLEAGPGSNAGQTPRILMAFEPACLEHRPDRALPHFGSYC